MNGNIESVEINFEGEKIKNIFKKIWQIETHNEENIVEIKAALKHRIPVKVNFVSLDREYVARLLDFITGMSAYFGASVKVLA